MHKFFQFLLWETIISFPIFAMELPENNNNNNVPQKTISHLVGVQSLKELCCKALAQHIGAYCKKQHTWFPASPEDAADVCEKLKINNIVNEAIFDDLVRVAATSEGEVAEGCHVDYECTEFLHPKIPLILTRDDKTWEIYNPEMNCTTGSVPFQDTHEHETKRWIVSPCAKILALCGKDMLSLYDLEASMPHAWYELGQHDKGVNLKLLSTYPALISSRTFFLNSQTIVGMDQLNGNEIGALDLDSGNTKLIHKGTFPSNAKRITDHLFVFVDLFSVKQLALFLLEQNNEGEWREPKKIGTFARKGSALYPRVILATGDSPPQIITSTMLGSVVLYTIDTAVQKREVQAQPHCKYSDAATAVFSPNGESVAILWGNQLYIYRCADLQPLWHIALEKSSSKQIIWPSFETGLLEPGSEIMFYNTVVAHVLGIYKKSLEQNNNNNTAKIDA